MELSVVIPAYNEEKRIGDTLNTVSRFCRAHCRKYEILLVDDGSHDATAAIASHHADVRILANSMNRGKGHAVRRGLLEARHPLVLFSDSDLATPIGEVARMAAHVKKGYDIIIASRNMRASDVRVKQPLYRQLMGKSFPLMVNTIALRGFRDTQCGFKLFRRTAAHHIAGLQILNSFCFDVEMLFIAIKCGYTVKEIPVPWVDGGDSTVHPVRDSAGMLADLFRIRYNSWRGRYACQS